MKRIMMAGWVVAVLAAGAASAQDVPGFSVGGFYETRIDNQVDDQDLSFDYVGGRVQFRDERWYSLYLDVGSQSAEWDDYEADSATFVGFGGTLWLARAEDFMIPIDVGLSASFHQGDVDLERNGATYSATYSQWTAQGVLRVSGYGMARPFVRAGVMHSKLEDFDVGDDSDWDVYNPAVNVGLELGPTDQFVVTVEANYSEKPGFGIRADLWF